MKDFTKSPRTESTITSSTPETVRTTSRTATRRRHDLWLLGLVTVVLVGLYAEMVLRLSDMLPALPLVPFNLGEALFAAANGIGLVGTLVLAFTAPPAATDEVVDTEPVTAEEPGDRPSAARRPLRPVLTDV